MSVCVCAHTFAICLYLHSYIYSCPSGSVGVGHWVPTSLTWGCPGPIDHCRGAPRLPISHSTSPASAFLNANVDGCADPLGLP